MYLLLNLQDLQWTENGIRCALREIQGLCQCFQIRADVRSKYNRVSMKKMVEMITPIICMCMAV